MSFMKPQVVYGTWYEVDGNFCTEWLPADFGEVDLTSLNEDGGPIPGELRDYSENTEYNTIKLTTGYGARMSAPGYMDCTEWVVFDTKKEAEDYLEEDFGPLDDDEEEKENDVW